MSAAADPGLTLRCRIKVCLPSLDVDLEVSVKVTVTRW